MTNFMLFMTARRVNCCKFCSWKWFRSFTSSYGFGVILLLFRRPRHQTSDKSNKPFIVPVDMASIYFRPESSVMWVGVPWLCLFRGAKHFSVSSQDLCLWIALQELLAKVFREPWSGVVKIIVEKYCRREESFKRYRHSSFRFERIWKVVISVLENKNWVSWSVEVLQICMTLPPLPSPPYFHLMLQYLAI